MRKRIKSVMITIIATIVIMVSGGIISNLEALAATNEGYNFSTAKPINLGTSYYKEWDSKTDSEDFFTVFTITKKGYITFKFDKPIGYDNKYLRLNFDLYNESAESIWWNSPDVYNSVLPYYEFSVGVEPGTYYLNTTTGFSIYSDKVYSNYNVKFTENNNVEVENNDVASRATEVNLDAKIKGFIGNGSYYTRDADLYKLSVEKAISIKLSISNFENLVKTSKSFYFSNSNLDEEWLASSYWKIDKDGSYYIYLPLSPGDNYISVKGYNEQIEYNISFNKTSVDKGTLSLVKKIGDYAELKWIQANEADGYIIYRSSNESGQYSKVRTISNKMETNYRDYIGSSKYYYKIVPYKSAFYDIYGESSAPQTFTNNLPLISASDVKIIQGMDFKAENYVKATDIEDGDLKSSVTYTGKVDVKEPGVYSITYNVKDAAYNYVKKEIDVTVVKSDWYSHWGFSAIKLGMEKGIVDVSEKFRPEDSITRAEFIKLVNKTFGYTQVGNISFKDVKSNSWFYNEVKIAAKAGYISTANETFRPDSPITREEVAVIIANLMKIHDNNFDKLNVYTDKGKVSNWAKSSVEGVIEAGYMGKGSFEFRPQAKMVRAEAVTALSRVK